MGSLLLLGPPPPSSLVNSQPKLLVIELIARVGILFQLKDCSRLWVTCEKLHASGWYSQGKMCGTKGMTLASYASLHTHPSKSLSIQATKRHHHSSKTHSRQATECGTRSAICLRKRSADSHSAPGVEDFYPSSQDGPAKL